MAIFLLVVSVGAVGGAVGILYMLFGPTSALLRIPPVVVPYEPLVLPSAAAFAPVLPYLDALAPEPPPLPAPEPEDLSVVSRVEEAPAAPRLGVSAPQRSRHLAPPPLRRSSIPSLPRTRSARGSDAPPVPPHASASTTTAVPIEPPAPRPSDTAFTLVD